MLIKISSRYLKYLKKKKFASLDECSTVVLQVHSMHLSAKKSKAFLQSFCYFEFQTIAGSHQVIVIVSIVKLSTV